MHGALSSRGLRVSATFAALVCAAALLVGCSTSEWPSGEPSYSAKPIPNSDPNYDPVSSPGNTMTVAGEKCACCASGRHAPRVKGRTKMIGNRQQLITVKIRKGYYTPNTFTVKQGVPVVVVFSGVAHGCLSRPTFKFLGKVGELRNGSATVDLGPLDAGVYTFTCSMGQNVGVITVR